MSKLKAFSGFLIISLPIIFLITIFCGINTLGIEVENYDLWRLQQIIIFNFSLFLFLIFIKKELLFFHKKNNPKNITIILASLILIGFTIYYAKSSILAIVDLLFYISAVFYCVVLIKTLQLLIQNNHKFLAYIENGLAITTFSPLYIIFYCLLSYYLLISQNINYTNTWHILFNNIRYYNDTLLPLLFLLWFKPGFLKKESKIVVIISSLYLLTLWLDAARAVWLGIVIGLGFIFFKSSIKALKIPLISIGLSFLLYLFLIKMQPEVASYNVLRETSSGRLFMWISSGQYLLQHYGFGIGGENFIFANSLNIKPPVGHIHNIVMQFFIEWGWVGLLFILYLGYQFLKVFILSNKIPVLLSGGAIAIVINMLLSGAGVYPQSQMAIFLFFAYSIYFYSQNSSLEEPEKSLTINGTLAWRNSLKFMVVIVNILLLIYTVTSYQKINATICDSESQVENIEKSQKQESVEISPSQKSPRFWQDATFIPLN